MAIPFFIVFGVVLVAFAPLTFTSTARGRTRALSSYAKRLGTDTASASNATTITRIRRRERVVLAGGALGLLASAGAAFVLPGHLDDPILPMVIFALTCSGATLGAATASAASALRSTDAQRVARLTTPTRSDYVPGPERWGARFAPAAAVISVSAAAIASSLGLLGEPRLSLTWLVGSIGGVLAIASLVALALTEAISGRIVATAQPAHSPSELATDDAFKAMALRDVTMMPIFLGFSATILIFLDVGSRPDVQGVGLPSAIIGFVLLMAIFGAAIALVTWSLVTRPQQFYRRRLWTGARL